MTDVQAGASEEVLIEAEHDIVRARSEARDFARGLGFGVVDQSRITTAVSELARNVVKYATGGRGRVRISQAMGADGQRGIEIVVADDGPGIASVEHAMRDGTSTSGSLGLGLPGTRRLMDEMTVESEQGTGTEITIRKWLR
jgi:serine/threonine-protein kinase RsbT